MSRLLRSITACRSATKIASRPSSQSTRPIQPAARSTPYLPYPQHFQHTRLYSSSTTSEPTTITPPEYLSAVELSIFNKLQSEFQPVKLEVQDISGGCGSMFGLDIVSQRFKGLTVIKQHQLVNKVLAEEIKTWHGMQLKTKAA